MYDTAACYVLQAFSGWKRKLERCVRAGVGNLFWTADRVKTEFFLRTGLQKYTNVQQWIFITTHVSYYNFDLQHGNFDGRCDLCSLNSVVAVFNGGVAIVLNFCNLEFES